MTDEAILAAIEARIAIYRIKQETRGNPFGEDTLTEWDAYERCIGAIEHLAWDLGLSFPDP